MFTTLEDGNRIARAQAVFEERIQEAASKSGLIKLGHQGGGRETMVHFVARLNFWIGLEDARNRYWNALGTGNPFKQGRPIVAEINPPKTGINRAVSGAFVEDDAGTVHLVHRGRVGGGRKGIGKKAFMAWYKGTIDITNDQGRDNEIIVIGALDDEKLIENLAAFTKSVEAFKVEVVSGVRATRDVEGQDHDTLPQQLLGLISKRPGLTDRELTRMLRGASAMQQPINLAARALEFKGWIARKTRADNLIGNYPVDGPDVPPPSFRPPKKNLDLQVLSEDEIKRCMQIGSQIMGGKPR